MTKTLKTALAAIAVIGTASVALADDYTDPMADGIHIHMPAVAGPSVAGQPVALLYATGSDGWMDQASRSYDGGGY